jgi:hypothetical protein
MLLDKQTWVRLYGEESLRWDEDFRHWIEETAACRITDIDPTQTLRRLNEAVRRHRASLSWRARLGNWVIERRLFLPRVFRHRL